MKGLNKLQSVRNAKKYLSYCTRQRVMTCAYQLKIIYLHIGLVSYEL